EEDRPGRADDVAAVRLDALAGWPRADDRDHHAQPARRPRDEDRLPAQLIRHRGAPTGLRATTRAALTGGRLMFSCPPRARTSMLRRAMTQTGKSSSARSERRKLLTGVLALGDLSAAPALIRRAGAQPRLPGPPFTLGVASGYPTPSGVALWTRLAPAPLIPGGGMPPEVVPVAWEVATDERMGRIVQRGVASATRAFAHAVHVEVDGLEPARWSWYRFGVGGEASAIGRTRTAPAASANTERLRLAFASCQQWEQGYFNAYRHMLADDLDLIVHLGDYIYESSWGQDHVRRHGAPEPHTLDDYRIRHALYKSDPDLRAAHAACPWLLTWDDHEVQNDYANDRSEHLDTPAWFLERRAAAYRAYYEHMPLRRSMVPFGPHMRMFSRV